LLQQQHVGVGQQKIEAFDQQDRKGDRKPAAEIVTARAGIEVAAESAVEHDHLADHRYPDRSRAGEHRNGGAEPKSKRERARGDADDQGLADDKLRHQPQAHPVVRARDAVLGVGDHEGRQCEAADVKRHDGIRVDPRPSQMDDACEQHRADCRKRERQPPTAGEEAAQQRVLATGAILRNDFLCRSRDPEIHHAAEQQDPGPDVHVHAVVRAAHPARQQDLRKVSQRRTGDADQEDRAREPTRQRSFVGAGQQHSQPPDEACRASCCGL